MSIPPPDSRPSPLVPGFRLDRYELLCPLAQGGMAQVWIARLLGKHGFEKLVAIKTILPQYASDHRFQRMFLDEAHIAAGIEHANVAQILDLGEQHDVLYLVMEWVDGEAISKLQRWIEKKNETIPFALIVRMLADACGGLHAAHELRGKDGELLNVVHRDVSPQNILVSAKGVAKIIDFGIAKARDRFAGETNAGILKGKIQYMAPEQAVGKVMDRRADVWAVGAIAYHMLAGKPPFDGPNQLATLHKLTSGRPPLPLPDRVPKPIADVVRRALVHDPEKRIKTAAEMQAAFEEALVQSGLRASSNDVASYVREHMSDRADARKKAIDVALGAAAERMRVEQVLALKPTESASGISSSGLKPPSIPSMPSLSDLARSASEPPTAHAVVTAATKDGLSTPGSAVAISDRRDPQQKKKMFIVGGAAAAVLLIVVVIASVSRRDPPAPAAAASAPPKATVAAVPTPTPTPTPTATAPPPTVSASATQTTAPVAGGTAAPKATVAPKATATATTPKKPKPIDDGF